MNLIHFYERKRGLGDLVNRVLELARADKIIGSSEEADVYIASSCSVAGDYLTTEELVCSDVTLRDFLLVSNATVVKDLPSTSHLLVDSIFSVAVLKSSSKRCERCRKGCIHLNTFIDEPGLCWKCYQIIKEGIDQGNIAWNNEGYYWTDMFPISEDDSNHLPMNDYPNYWKDKYSFEVFVPSEQEWTQIRKKVDDLKYMTRFRTPTELEQY